MLQQVKIPSRVASTESEQHFISCRMNTVTRLYSNVVKIRGHMKWQFVYSNKSVDVQQIRVLNTSVCVSGSTDYLTGFNEINANFPRKGSDIRKMKPMVDLVYVICLPRLLLTDVSTSSSQYWPIRICTGYSSSFFESDKTAVGSRTRQKSSCEERSD